MAEFDSAQAHRRCVEAARSPRATPELEAYTPVPVEELNDIIHKKRTKLLDAGPDRRPDRHGHRLRAAVLGLGDRVPDERRRPAATRRWPAFVVPVYELTILFSALTAAIGMFALNGLPQPYHPVFNVERFSMASSDKFFLVIEAEDPHFDQGATTRVPAGPGREGSVRRCGVTVTGRVALSSRRSAAWRRLPPGHARRARATRPTRRARSFADGRGVAHAAGRHRRARLAARRRSALHRQGQRRAGRRVPVPDRRRRHGSAAGSATTSTARRATASSATARAWWCSAVSGRPPSYHQDRLRDEQLGYFFDVITNGFGAMQGYAEQIPVRDRWLIAAYVRALQLSQNATIDEVPAERQTPIWTPSRRTAPGGGPRTAPRRPQRRQGIRGQEVRRRTGMTTETFQPPESVSGLQRLGMIAAVVGVVLAVVGFAMSGLDRFFQAYLVAYVVLARRRARQHGAADGAAPVRRRLGRGDPPAARGGGQHAAGDGGAVPADRARHAQPLSLDARRGR